MFYRRMLLIPGKKIFKKDRCKMRKRKIRLIYVIIIIVLFIIAMAVLGMSRDSIVIANGIRFYRNIRKLILIIGCILSAAIIILYIIDSVFVLRARKNFNEAQAAVKAQEEANLFKEKQQKENLSVSREMDSARLRQILNSYSAGQWSSLSGQLRQLCIQLDMMDEQQAKLSHLIENNGADALSNTEDLLNKVEQYMCRSVRKVINYMDVANASDAADASRVQEKIYECHTDLQQQIQQVQEFLFAFADFLNTQGDDDSSLQMLDMYKTTILESIKE